MEKVSIATTDGYELISLRKAVIKLLEPIGGISAFISSGERVLLKPNLLSAKEPDKAVTTHPAIVRVVAELVSEAGGIVLIGDSPGIGGFSRVAEKSGIYDAARDSGASLIEFKEGVDLQGNGTFRSIRLARAYYEADKIINLPKLKTHEMMTMTCAVKNLFGAVVGTEKAGWHLKAGRSQQLFARLLLEIYLLKKPVLNIVDAITAMEGNGPGSGDPIKLGLLIAGANPVAVDVTAGRLAGIPAELLHIELEAISMGLPGAIMGDIILCGTPIESIPKIRFKLPAGLDVQFGLPSFLTKALKSHLTSYPAADHEACVLCGICRDACPPGAITIQNSALSVDNARCIRCWCCRELCPLDAMQVRRGLLLRTLLLLSRNKNGL
ncbi:MAG: DUF362 domain-containing protein [Geobacteraceae bacterium]|nr:DUF362 domain-containing protein [Geobacteraceae bacterium]NTW81547.1 DUF362 domain-containing protein [Geobacteraceae bacterium]